MWQIWVVWTSSLCDAQALGQLGYHTLIGQNTVQSQYHSSQYQWNK